MTGPRWYVGDIDLIIREISGPAAALLICNRPDAGTGWWLAAAWLDAEAEEIIAHQIWKRHPRQVELDEMYERLRAGLDPDPSILTDGLMSPPRFDRAGDGTPYLSPGFAES